MAGIGTKQVGVLCSGISEFHGATYSGSGVVRAAISNANKKPEKINMALVRRSELGYPPRSRGAGWGRVHVSFGSYAPVISGHRAGDRPGEVRRRSVPIEVVVRVQMVVGSMGSFWVFRSHNSRNKNAPVFRRNEPKLQGPHRSFFGNRARPYQGDSGVADLCRRSIAEEA